MGVRGEWRWGWIKKVKGNKRDKLPIIRSIRYRDVMYRIGK